MEAFAEWLVNIVELFGYGGIFLATFLGNTMVPVPLEVIMIPAGYLIERGDMHFWIVLPGVIISDVLGSLCAYWFAFHFGRRFIFAYGKYVFFKHEKMEMLDKFFASHGEISVLTGRLIPGLRHFMAFPAGMAHMDVKKFIAYTGTGGGLWSATLILVGYLIGGNEALVKHYMPLITGAVSVGVVIMIIVYTLRHRRKTKEKLDGTAG